MSKFLGYRCSLCNKEYLPEQDIYICACGGNLDVVLDYETIRKKYHMDDVLCRDDSGLWRFLPLLPVYYPKNADDTPLSLAGQTPILSLSRLAQKLNLSHLWLKDEARNPTGSFKDRASALVVARAVELSAPRLVVASTGNAGAALAGISAAAGLPCVIFAPKNTTPAKLAQLLIYGAKVLLIDGNYDEAFDLSVQAANAFGWYCRNTGYNPFTLEGKKTIAFEIWEWASCNGVAIGALTIFVPVGDGNLIAGLYKGFKDLLALGWLDQMPRLVGVQSEGSAAVANAFQQGGEQIAPVASATLADSISVNLPRDGVRAIRAVRESGGTFLAVTDEEILSAIAELGSVGVFAEPAAAAAYAGLAAARASGKVPANAPALVISTGSGLKDIRAAMQTVRFATVIEPTLDAVKKHA